MVQYVILLWDIQLILDWKVVNSFGEATINLLANQEIGLKCDPLISPKNNRTPAVKQWWHAYPGGIGNIEREPEGAVTFYISYTARIGML